MRARPCRTSNPLDFFYLPRHTHAVAGLLTVSRLTIDKPSTNAPHAFPYFSAAPLPTRITQCAHTYSPRPPQSRQARLPWPVLRPRQTAWPPWPASERQLRKAGVRTYVRRARCGRGGCGRAEPGGVCVRDVRGGCKQLARGGGCDAWRHTRKYESWRAEEQAPGVMLAGHDAQHQRGRRSAGQPRVQVMPRQQVFACPAKRAGDAKTAGVRPCSHCSWLVNCQPATSAAPLRQQWLPGRSALPPAGPELPHNVGSTASVACNEHVVHVDQDGLHAV
eukprot:366515-Chlamydomonas_euryale.AAC.1